MANLQQLHERRLDRFLADLARQVRDAPARVKVRGWLKVRAAAISCGCTVEEAEQYADRWWLDGGF